MAKQVVVPVYLVHKTIEAEYIHDFLVPDSVGISVKLHNQLIKYFCVYRSQNLSFTERSELLQSLKMIKCKSNEEIQIYGDFNLPSVNWDLGVINCPNNTVNPFYTIQQDFYTTLSEKGLNPLIKGGTVTRRRISCRNLCWIRCWYQTRTLLKMLKPCHLLARVTTYQF